MAGRCLDSERSQKGVAHSPFLTFDASISPCSFLSPFRFFFSFRVFLFSPLLGEPSKEEKERKDTWRGGGWRWVRRVAVPLHFPGASLFSTSRNLLPLALVTGTVAVLGDLLSSRTRTYPAARPQEKPWVVHLAGGVKADAGQSAPATNSLTVPVYPSTVSISVHARSRSMWLIPSRTRPMPLRSVLRHVSPKQERTPTFLHSPNGLRDRPRLVVFRLQLPKLSPPIPT